MPVPVPSTDLDPSRITKSRESLPTLCQSVCRVHGNLIESSLILNSGHSTYCSSWLLRTFSVFPLPTIPELRSPFIISIPRGAPSRRIATTASVTPARGGGVGRVVGKRKDKIHGQLRGGPLVQCSSITCRGIMMRKAPQIQPHSAISPENKVTVMCLDPQARRAPVCVHFSRHRFRCTLRRQKARQPILLDLPRRHSSQPTLPVQHQTDHWACAIY